MRVLLPPPLKPGDCVGVAAPAGPGRQPGLDRGLDHLRGRGFEVVTGASLRRRSGYLAGTDAERLDDLNRFLRDPAVRAIWFARGGYGSARIVEGADLKLLKTDPKVLIGYSDITVLHAAAWKTARLSTIHGPLVSELADPEAYDAPSLWRTLDGGDLSLDRALGGATVWRHGAGEGPLIGGCLSMLASLVGTPYDWKTDGAILFWEDVGEEPYRIDRMLGQLRMAGRLAGLRAMIVGRLVGCTAREPENDAPLGDILARHLEGTDYPVVVDFPAGHAPGKVTLPLGRRAGLDTRAGRLSIASR
jgi:muramoyltetrapeptide carboxypeptidase